VSTARVRLGQRGEELTATELSRRGYDIVARNWRCQTGEVDIVARRDSVWYFFEVRTRRGTEYGTPEESLTATKQQRMVDVALTYLGKHDLLDLDWRIGLAAVEIDRRGQLVRLELYESIT